MNCNTSRFGSKVIHRTAFGTDVSIRSRRTLKAPCKYAALFFHIWYNNLKPAACAAARTSCADALLRMGLKYCIAENRGSYPPAKSVAGV